MGETERQTDRAGGGREEMDRSVSSPGLLHRALFNKLTLVSRNKHVVVVV